MVGVVIAAFAAQAVLALVDERAFHRRRGLARWERIGHPLDTATVVACYAWLVATRASHANAIVYAVLALFSSLFVTKDEPIHSTSCSSGEHWVHAMLFTLHPTVLLGAGWLWWTDRPTTFIAIQLAFTIVLLLYQSLYWNGPWRRAT